MTTSREDELLNQKNELDKKLEEFRAARKDLETELKDYKKQMKQLGKDDPNVSKWLAAIERVQKEVDHLNKMIHDAKMSTRTNAIETTVSRIKEHVGKLQTGGKIEYSGFSGLMKKVADMVLNLVGKFLLFSNKKNEQRSANRMAKEKGAEASEKAQSEFFKQHKQGQFDPNRDKQPKQDPFDPNRDKQPKQDPEPNDDYNNDPYLRK